MLIIGVLVGIFVGIASAGYMFIKPLADRDKTISKLKEYLLKENNKLQETKREKENLKEDLSIAYKELELKDKQIECIRTLLEQNDYGRDDLKIAKIKELVADLADNN